MARGCRCHNAELPQGPVVNRASMVIDAAVDGQGIALARTTLAAWDLISGRLVRPFAETLRLSKTYWIICPKATSKLPKISDLSRLAIGRGRTRHSTPSKIGSEGQTCQAEYLINLIAFDVQLVEPLMIHLDRRKLLGGLATTLRRLSSLHFHGQRNPRAAPLARSGEFEITVISDGHLTIPTRFLASNVSEADIKAWLGTTAAMVTPPTNVTLVRTPSETVLIDVGAGPHFMPGAGKLAENMEAAGIDRNAVTKVVFTHAHPDHIWGTLDDFDDEPMFRVPPTLSPPPNGTSGWQTTWRRNCQKSARTSRQARNAISTRSRRNYVP